MKVDQRIFDAMKDSHAFTWDECHKIYITADPEMTAQMEEYGYEMNKIDSVSDCAKFIQEWYDDSCPLRFVQKIRSPGNNEDYENVIPQFDDH